MSSRRWSAFGLGLVFVGVPSIAFLPVPGFLNAIWQVLLYSHLLSVGVLALLLLVIGREGFSLASVGMKAPNRGDLLGAALIFWLLVMLDGLAVGPLIERLGLSSSFQGSEFGTDAAIEPVWSVVLGTVILAPLLEELAFRGYSLERLGALTGHMWMAAPIPIAIFTWIHVPGQGNAAWIDAGTFAVVVTGLYVWRRNLWCCVLVHAAWNAMASAPTQVTEDVYLGVFVFGSAFVVTASGWAIRSGRLRVART